MDPPTRDSTGLTAWLTGAQGGNGVLVPPAVQREQEGRPSNTPLPAQRQVGRLIPSPRGKASVQCGGSPCFAQARGFIHGQARGRLPAPPRGEGVWETEPLQPPHLLRAQPHLTRSAREAQPEALQGSSRRHQGKANRAKPVHLLRQGTRGRGRPEIRPQGMHCAGVRAASPAAQGREADS